MLYKEDLNDPNVNIFDTSKRLDDKDLIEVFLYLVDKALDHRVNYHELWMIKIQSKFPDFLLF